MFLRNFLLTITPWAKVSWHSNCHYNEFCHCIECRYKEDWLYQPEVLDTFGIFSTSCFTKVKIFVQICYCICPMEILYQNILKICSFLTYTCRGWSGGAKVSCILCHRGVQLILAYSWARPAILVAGKGRGGMFLFLLFLHFHSCSSFFPVPLFHLFDYLFYHSSPFLWETTQNDPQGLTCR